MQINRYRANKYSCRSLSTTFVTHYNRYEANPLLETPTSEIRNWMWEMKSREMRQKIYQTISQEIQKWHNKKALEMTTMKNCSIWIKIDVWPNGGEGRETQYNLHEHTNTENDQSPLLFLKLAVSGVWARKVKTDESSTRFLSASNSTHKFLFFSTPLVDSFVCVTISCYLENCFFKWFCSKTTES